MFDHYVRLCFTWTNSLIFHSIEYTKTSIFLATIKYDIKYKHLVVYMEGAKKKIIDVFNNISLK